MASWRDNRPTPDSGPRGESELRPRPSLRPTIDFSPARYVLFAANDPLLALKAPSKYAVALSADPAYRSFATPGTVEQLHGQGHRVYAWCDCRAPSEGTPPEVAKQLVADLGLDSWCGQAESPDQFDRALAAGAPMVVGNVSVLTAAQKDAVRQGRLLFIAEDFWNTMPWSKPDWQGLPVAASCVGIYDASRESENGRYLSLADYDVAGRFMAGDGLFHVGGMRAEDWALL